MRIATWNVNSLKARLEKVMWWLERAKPDVLLMQETKLADADAPVKTFKEAGYELVHHGEGRWNGVAIASRCGIGGIITAAPDLVALLWLQSRLVWYIAAAYGFDPNHPMRPAEYLALQGLYDTPAEARAALDGVGKRMAQAMAEQALLGRNTEALHMRLAKYVAQRVARRYAGRLIPLIGAPIGAVQNGNATSRLGRSAIDYYGGQARP